MKRLIVFLTNLTLPSHIPTLTPPGCRLRAALVIWVRSPPGAPMQGGFMLLAVLQYEGASIWSGSLLLGARKPSNAAPPYHHPNPRRSNAPGDFPWPWMTSPVIMVLLS